MMRHPKCPKRRSTPSAPGKFCSGGLFDEITDALLIIESDGGRILCSNREAQRLFDKGADDLAGRPFELLIAPSARTRVHAALDTVSQEATGSRSAARPLARVEVVSSAAQPVEVEMWLAQGGPAISPVTHILALFRALDRDRMRNGHEKVERDEHFDLLDLAQDAIFVRDFSTRTIRYWNRGAETLYGWSAAEAIGQVSDSLLATRFPEPLEVIESSLASDGQWHGELVHTAHDGRRIVVNSRWALRRDSNGSPAAILEVNTDVTERRQADELLREQAALLDLVPDAVLVRDFNTGRIKHWNRGAQALYGWSRSEALGKVTQELLAGQLPRDASELGNQLLDSGHWEGEVAQVARDGRRLIVASRWALRRGDDGQPKDILVISTDITERKRADRELSRLAAAEAACESATIC